MRRLRERLALWVVKVLTWLVLRIVPAYGAPAQPRWTVRLDPCPDTVVSLIFVPYPRKPHKYHIVTHYNWDSEAIPLVVDGGTKAHIHPVSTELTVERLARAYKASHVVTVLVREDYEYGRPPPPGSIGPISCATLGKQLIGYDDETILTPEQLLVALWRMRDDNCPG